MKKGKVNILHLFALFCVFAISATYSSGATLVKIGRLLLTIIFIICNFNSLNMKSFLKKYSVICILFYLYSALTIFWAISTENVIIALSTQLYILIVDLILYNIMDNNPSFIYKIIDALIIGSIALGIYIYSRFGITVFMNARTVEGAGNANTIAFISSFAIMFAFAMTKMRNLPKKKNNLYFLSMIINAMFALLSASKKIFIFLGVFFAVYLLFTNNPLKLFRNIIIIIVALAIVRYLIMNNEFLYNLIGHRITIMFSTLNGAKADGSTGFRISLLNWGLEWFKQRPLFGYGLDCFKYKLGSTYQTWAGYNAYAHNNYIELLVDFGLVGTLIYYSLYIDILKKSFSKIRESKKNVVILALILSLMVGEFAQVSYSKAFLQIVLLLIWVLSHNKLEDKKATDN